MNDTQAGNYYNKYESSNPIVQWIMNGFLSTLDELVERVQPDTIHEVGCGEGYLTTHLSEQGHEIRGSDFSEEAVNQARHRANGMAESVSFSQRNIYDLDPDRDGAELIVCCEVLEHLDQPGRALRRLTACANPYLILSVPREPLWRILNMLRFRYWTDFGNTPGHVQHWSQSQFKSFVNQCASIREQRSPIPWTMFLCYTDGSA